MGIPPAQPPPNADECSRPHERKVNNHGNKDTEDISDVVKNLFGLFRKDHDDGVEQPNQGEWRKVWEEFRCEEFAAAEENDGITSDNARGERNAKILEGQSCQL